MVNNLLVVGWVNGNQPVASVRRARYVSILSCKHLSQLLVAIINPRIHGMARSLQSSVHLGSMQPTSVSSTDAKNAHLGLVVQAGST